MSSQDVDKLFRDVLGQGQATPRPEAWARVFANLPKAQQMAQQKVQQKVQPKRRTLWWPYAAAASVAIAAVSTWWLQAPRQQAAGNQQLVASNQQPVVRNQLPAASNQKRMDRFDMAFLPRMEAESFEDLVPLLDRQVVVAVQAPSPEVPRPRYLQLAANVQNVWSAVRQYREAEVPAQLTLEVRLPAPVLRRINQTQMLASNLNQSLNQSWSTLYSRRSR